MLLSSVKDRNRYTGSTLFQQPFHERHPPFRKQHQTERETLIKDGDIYLVDNSTKGKEKLTALSGSASIENVTSQDDATSIGEGLYLHIKEKIL